MCAEPPLSQHVINGWTKAALSRTRYIIERFFRIAKLHYGMANARYLGLAGHKMRLAMIFMARNIKRREIDRAQENYT